MSAERLARCCANFTADRGCLGVPPEHLADGGQRQWVANEADHCAVLRGEPCRYFALAVAPGIRRRGGPELDDLIGYEMGLQRTRDAGEKTRHKARRSVEV